MRANEFMPHCMCLLWKPELLLAHVLADGLIAFAYFSIPIFLIWITHKRGDIPFSWVFWLFAIFILSCGTTHILAIWVIWHPVYVLEAVIKWVTAIASIGTAIMLIPLTPKILRIRTPEQADELINKLRREHSIATTYQNASLPKVPQGAPGLDIHAIYRPAVRDLEIGGDWYDAFTLLDGRLLVSIGDVTGKGLQASVIMSKVRQSIRIASQIVIDPVAILDAADRALVAEYPDAIVTAFIGVFDRTVEQFTYASAGHPGPVLRHADARTEALHGSSLPLGLRHRDETVASRVINLEDDSLFVFYTDGVIEYSHDFAAGEARLAEVVAMHGTVIASDPAAYIHDQVIVGESRDDIAILTVGVKALARNIDAQEWDFNVLDEFKAANARQELIAFLRSRGFETEDLATAELIYAELIGNVLRHAPGPVKVRIEWHSGRAVLNIFDQGPGFQHMPRLPNDVYAESGRGLYLISTLADYFHIARRPGKGSHARVVLVPVVHRLLSLR